MFWTVDLDRGSDFRSWVDALLEAEWGGTVARRGELVDPTRLDGVVALQDGSPVGVITYLAATDGWEIVTLNAIERRRGVGRVLVDAVIERARHAGADTVWLITTNDNLDAIAFYEAMGFEFDMEHAGAVDDARRTLKPSIPTHAPNGLLIRHELEFRLGLA